MCKVRIGRIDNKTGKSSGFSLLEVLVATTVFSFGLAGLAALLLTSFSSSAEARQEGLAAIAAASLAEQIRLNKVALNHYTNPLEVISAICLAGGSCSPGQQADYDFSLWQIELAVAIKGARGVVCLDATPLDGTADNSLCDGAGPLVIKIFWNGPANETGRDGNPHRFTLEVS